MAHRAMVSGWLILCAFACSNRAHDTGTADSKGGNASSSADGGNSAGASNGGVNASGGSAQAGGNVQGRATSDTNNSAGTNSAGTNSAGSSTTSSGGVSGSATGGKTSSATGGKTSSATGGGVGGTSTSAGSGGKSTPIAVKDLPTITEMPDPLTMNDGTQVTSVDQWKQRRQEMIRILEDYEYGHMPPAPGNVKATTVTASKSVSSGGTQANYRMLHLTFGPNDTLGFDLGLFAPAAAAQSAGKPPILISLVSSANESSLGSASAALARGYAVATIAYAQLGADSTSWAKSAFFPAYPDYDWRDISAWAWGLSRAVDYLVTDDAFDSTKIMITGVSRLAQAVLLAGAFDERIALSAPVAGGAALRFSGKEMGGGLGQGITEIVDQNTYWFGPRFPEFKNQTPKLPSDQHWLPALTAPRLFIMCNSLSDQYGRAYAAVQTYLNAKPVYDFLNASDNIGLNFRAGTHGITAEDWSAILDFADQYLLKKGGTKKFDVLPPRDQTP